MTKERPREVTLPRRRVGASPQLAGTALAAALAGGCREAPTLLVLNITSPDLRGGTELTHVQVTAAWRGVGAGLLGDAGSFDLADGGYALPGRVVVTPPDPGESRKVILTVRASVTEAGGSYTVTQVFVTGFARGRTKEVFFALSRRCDDRRARCAGDGLTCVPTATGPGCAAQEAPVEADYAPGRRPDALPAWQDVAALDAPEPGARDADVGLDAAEPDAPPDAADARSDVAALDTPAVDTDDDADDDAFPSDDGAAADACDGPCTADLPAPRPVAPLSSAVVATLRPTLAWGGAAGAQVELCRDRACTAPLWTARVTGASAIPPAGALAGVRVAFWRLRGWDGARVGRVASPTWEFWLPRAESPGAVDTSWGVRSQDVDGDGFQDTLLRAGDQRIFVYWGQPGAGAPAMRTELTLARVTNIGYDGALIVGDVDGDGLADVALADGAFDGRRGRVFIYYGRADRLLSAHPVPVTGPALGSEFANIRGVGDVNGDGFSDVWIGANRYMDSRGVSYVYYGRSLAGLGAAAPPFDAPTVIEAPTTTAERFGHAAAGAGDLDGDGFADVVVNAFGGGRSYAYFGSGGGLVVPPSGTSPPSLVGGVFADGVGDVTGDGYADVAVSDGSSVRVFLGGADRGALPARVITLPGTFQTGELTGADLDGDRLSDVIAGDARGASRAVVFPGRATGFGAEGLVVWSGVATMNGEFGASVRASDLNGDGRADALIAAATSEVVYVYYGSATLPTDAAAVRLPGFLQVH